MNVGNIIVVHYVWDKKLYTDIGWLSHGTVEAGVLARKDISMNKNIHSFKVRILIVEIYFEMEMTFTEIWIP